MPDALQIVGSRPLILAQSNQAFYSPAVPVPRASRRIGLSGRQGHGPITVRVTNFKSIASVELPDVRLTVIAGSNSSGKSSLLQALLFIAQSIGQQNPVINGDLVRLGEPRDVIRDGAGQLVFRFSFDETSPDDEHARVATEVVLRASEQILKPAAFSLFVDDVIAFQAKIGTCSPDLKERLFRSELPLSIDEPDALGLPADSYLSVFGLQPGRLIYQASQQDYRQTFDRMLEEASTAPFILDELVHLLASRGVTSELPEALRAKIAELRHGRRTTADFPFDSQDRQLLFDLFLQAEAPGGWASEAITLPALGGSRGSMMGFPGFRSRSPEAPHLAAVSRLSDAARRVEAFAASIVYLGPLRDDPRVAYPLGHTVTNLPVGEKGEFTAAYLEQHGDRRIRYVTPDGHSISERLQVAVSRWCKYLGIADTVDVESRGKLGHELKLGLYGHERDPTAVGVGASQLLPVVVLVLGSSSGDLALLEQPELHLHPKVQSRLGDFFATARPDVRLLVETHSEYLITRLRLRVARGDLSAEELAVLFARQTVLEHVYEEEGQEGIILEALRRCLRMSFGVGGSRVGRRGV